MSIYTFTVGDKIQCSQDLCKIRVEVEIMESRGFKPNFEKLEAWSFGILLDIVSGHAGHNELIDDAIHVRFTSADGTVLVDTITDRTRQFGSG